MVTRPASNQRGERGAAVFIVVMVIALLTAIGIVAARTASLVDTAAGYDRQATQTMYLAAYAGRAGAVEFGGKPRTYLDLLRQGKEQCPSNAQVQPLTAGAPIPCYKLFMSEVSKRIQDNYSGHTTLDSQSELNGGSLGPPLGQTPSATVPMLNGVFMIEMLEAFNSDPKAKSNVGGDPNAAHDVQVTLTAFAQNPFPGQLERSVRHRPLVLRRERLHGCQRSGDPRTRHHAERVRTMRGLAMNTHRVFLQLQRETR